MHLFFWWNTAHSYFAESFQSVYCVKCPPAYQTLMAMNTSFHTAALLHLRVLLFILFCLMTFVTKNVTQIWLTDNVS